MNVKIFCSDIMSLLFLCVMVFFAVSLCLRVYGLIDASWIFLLTPFILVGFFAIATAVVQALREMKEDD